MYFTRKFPKSGSWSQWFFSLVDWSYLFCRVLMTYTCMIALLASPAVVHFVQRISGVGEMYSAPTTRALGVFWTGEAGASGASTFFTADEASHLVDVHRVVMGLMFSTAVAVCWLVLIEESVVAEWVSLQLRRICVLIAVISLPVLIGFSFFFELFHRLLFPQGNYMFAPESVLIQSFPPTFWMLNTILLQTGAVVLLWLQSRHAER